MAKNSFLAEATFKEPLVWYIRTIFRKTNISYSLIRTRSRAYQEVINVPFS